MHTAFPRSQTARIVRDPAFLRWTDLQWRWSRHQDDVHRTIHVAPVSGSAVLSIVVEGTPHRLMLLVDVRYCSFKVVRQWRTLTRTAERDAAQWDAVAAFLIRHEIIPAPEHAKPLTMGA